MIENTKFFLYAFPLHLKEPNGYWDGLYREIKKDPRVCAFNNDFLRLLHSFRKRNIIHIHWPAILYASRRKIIAPFRLIFTLGIIAVGILRKDQLVWTMHNYKNHEEQYPMLESIAVSFLARFSNAIIVHTDAGRQYIAEKYNRTRGVHIIPHGNYIDFHGPRILEPDKALREKFQLRDGDNVFLSLGSIRPYKCLEDLIALFNSLPIQSKLIIAGKPFYKDYYEKLQNMVKGENIFFWGKSIPGDDLPRFFSIADFSIFAFKEVLTSGSVILSLSYGVPVVVPDLGDLHYIIKNGENGFCYRNAEELQSIMNNIQNLSEQKKEEMKRRCVVDMLELRFNDLAAKTMRAYGIL